MRIDGYEIVGELLADAYAAPEQTPRWPARDADGSLVELAPMRAQPHERAHALERFARVQAVTHPALPTLIALEGDPGVTPEMVLVSAHRRRIPIVRAARAQEGEGLALPLVCTIAHDVARVLAALHDADVVHGLVNAWSVAVGAEGGTCVDAPRILRAPAAPRDDVNALVEMMCSLICGTPFEAAVRDDTHEDDMIENDTYADSVVDEPMVDSVREQPAVFLAAHRKDAPRELIEIIAGDLEARAFADALARDLPWAQWSTKQMLDEMRALLPDDVDDFTR
jgi:hypothetical protein